MTRAALVSSLLIGSATAGPAGSDKPDWALRLTEEVAALRQELEDLRLEIETSRMSELQRLALSGEQQRLEVEQQVQACDEALAEIERQLAGGTLLQDERNELEARRGQLAAEEATRLRVELRQASSEEASARERLERQTQLWRMLVERKATRLTR